MRNKRKINIQKHLLLGVSVFAISITTSKSFSYAQTVWCPGNHFRQVECHDHKGRKIDISICKRLAHEEEPYIGDEQVMDDMPALTDPCEYDCTPTGSGTGSGSGGDGLGCGCGSSPSPSPGCPGPGGGDGGGSKVLCGYYYTRGLLDEHIYLGDLEFAKHSVDSATKRGYLLWAVPLVEYLYNHPNGLLEKIVQPFVTGWATEMAYQAGYYHKGSMIGKFEMAFISPIVKLLGLITKETSIAHLHAYQDIDADSYTFQGDNTAISIG